MKDGTPQEPAAIAGTPIAEVSRLLGIPMPTLRSWELRYGIPTGDRVPGRHRRYGAAEVHAIRLMRDQIARGQRAAAAAAVVRVLVTATGPAAPFVEEFLAGSTRADPLEMRRALNQANQELGLGSCIDDVLLPAMQQIGSWWQTGRCEIKQEHLSTETARGWLDRLNPAAPAPGADRAMIVLACGPRDLHTIGLEALAVLLRYRGRPCRVLGARTTALDFSTAIHAHRSPAAVLVCHLNSGRRAAIESMRSVTDQGVLLFYAGNAFTSAASRRALPGTYLGIHLQDACALIDRALTPFQPQTGQQQHRRRDAGPEPAICRFGPAESARR